MTDYQKGIALGLQLALDIVNRASDACHWLHQPPGTPQLDVFDVLARIITDLQTEPIECY